MHKKRGDTLIEVALAIGIFSMVAIVVTSVTSASTTNAQTSLEVTLTREDIDGQAEALRFIHESYISGSQSKDTSTNPYVTLWNAIKNRTVTITSATSRYLNYNPASCSTLYNGNGTLTAAAGNNPFLINTRQLGNLSSTNINNIVIAAQANGTNRVFYSPSTFPRILYGGQSVTNNADSIYSQTEGGNNTLTRAEGIYIIGFRDPGSYIANGRSVSKQSAYYDFYIRSCWTPPNALRASTISTLVRLYDPAVITY